MGCPCSTTADLRARQQWSCATGIASARKAILGCLGSITRSASTPAIMLCYRNYDCSQDYFFGRPGSTTRSTSTIAMELYCGNREIAGVPSACRARSPNEAERSARGQAHRPFLLVRPSRTPIQAGGVTWRRICNLFTTAAVQLILPSVFLSVLAFISQLSLSEHCPDHENPPAFS